MMVIGVGNGWRGDDAAGLEVVRRLRRRFPEGATLREIEDEPLRLLDEWAGEREVVVVDAVRARDGPGTIHRLDVSSAAVPEQLRGRTTHHLGVAEAIELARALDRLPRRVELIGIEGHRFGAGGGLTSGVESAVEATTVELAERLVVAGGS